MRLIIERLTTVGYYRLSAYWHPFRKPHPSDARHLLDEFKPGTTFDEVWCRYAFDRRLRLLVMDAIERIEVSLRALLATHHSQRYGAFAYATDQRSVPSLDASKFADYRADIIKEQTRSKDTFVKHFYAKYGDSHSMLPLWMAAEVMAFGTLLTFHRGCDPAIRDTIARHYGVHEKVFASWLLAAEQRAEHLRPPQPPLEPRTGHQAQDPGAAYRVARPGQGHRRSGLRNSDHLQVVARSHRPAEPLGRALHALMNDSDGIPLESMGFPPNWRDCSIWKVGEV